jgi:hypothetical protein
MLRHMHASGHAGTHTYIHTHVRTRRERERTIEEKREEEKAVHKQQPKLRESRLYRQCTDAAAVAEGGVEDRNAERLSCLEVHLVRANAETPYGQQASACLQDPFCHSSARPAAQLGIMLSADAVQCNATTCTYLMPRQCTSFMRSTSSSSLKDVERDSTCPRTVKRMYAIAYGYI